MKLIQRYIGKTILSSIGLVVLVLIGLQVFVLFVSEFGSIGKGDYGVLQAFAFILLQVPYQVYLFFPVACVLGCLIGLGVLASHSELIVVRAAGGSIGQIIWAVLKAALLLIVIITILGETVIPAAVHYSEVRKAIETSGGQALRTSHGIWLRDNDSYIHIAAVLPGNRLQGIAEYKFNKNNQLVTASYAQNANYVNDRWLLNNVSTSNISEQKITSKQIKQMQWPVLISPRLLAVVKIEPDEMNLWALHRYISERKENRLSAGIYELSFWQRIFQPLSSCVMIFLAIPFIFGPLRSATMGSRILAGATVGFGFHILNKFFGPMSMVYQLPPIIAAAMPPLLFIIIAVILMRRVR